ncbi:uncharacterized protein PG998_006796 [Apiospora kogelbergensis]|uniref:uncharacterized protein n=1 Tax=Apiospora kogelbergensis TaxID=1337665 RepID=UPI0031318E00
MSLPPDFDKLIPPPTEINDAHKNYTFGATTAMMGSIGTVCVLVRLSIRYRSRSFGPDDYAIIPATVLFLAWCIMASYLCLNAGVGKPLWEITVDQFSMWIRGQSASLWLYPAMSGSIRISVLLFFRRIFGIDRTTNKIILVLLGLQAAYIITFSITPAFICKNFGDSVTFFDFGTHCSQKYFANIQTAMYTFSLAFDVVLFSLPVYPMFKLQMNKQHRVKVLFIFMCGIITTVPAAYKLAVSVKEWAHPLSADDPFRKYQMYYIVPGQYDVYGETFWIPSTLEPTLAIIATSLPAFRHGIAQLNKAPLAPPESLGTAQGPIKKEKVGRGGRL